MESLPSTWSTNWRSVHASFLLWGWRTASAFRSLAIPQDGLVTVKQFYFWRGARPGLSPAPARTVGCRSTPHLDLLTPVGKTARPDLSGDGNGVWLFKASSSFEKPESLHIGSGSPSVAVGGGGRKCPQPLTLIRISSRAKAGFIYSQSLLLPLRRSSQNLPLLRGPLCDHIPGITAGDDSPSPASPRSPGEGGCLREKPKPFSSFPHPAGITHHSRRPIIPQPRSHIVASSLFQSLLC